MNEQMNGTRGWMTEENEWEWINDNRRWIKMNE